MLFYPMGLQSKPQGSKSVVPAVGYGVNNSDYSKPPDHSLMVKLHIKDRTTCYYLAHESIFITLGA